MRTLSEHILDIAQNSTRAGAKMIEIIVEESKKKDLCSLTISDNGCGMDEETLKQATNPFFTSRTTRKVGLGLPLLKQKAEDAGGSFSLKSEPGKGTKLQAEFQLSNIDRPPMGDIWDTLYLLFLSYRDIQLVYRHLTTSGEFSISTSELNEALGDVSWQEKEIRNGIIELIKANLGEIGAAK
ncbi:ATP-binding protein [Maribellus sediminis]|uniref:ATP-binding protein n=1 Tax=Maribellus sediminis TaxID=2696285 RepID=UPI001431F43D|nr:ATP-binding protein [Maribellus sediminis]